MKGSSSPAAGKDGASGSSSKKNCEKPSYSRFSQQELSAWKPILTPAWVISTFTVIGIIFIPLGLASLFASERVVEMDYRYDKECIPSNYTDRAESFVQSTVTNKTCTKKWIVKKKMKAPFFVYYQLDNFYQNHRRYVKSRDDKQLLSKEGESGSSSCKPELLDNGKPVVPCGLIAWSLFNDTYSFSTKNKNLVVNKKNISWKSDRDKKFGSQVFPKNFQNGSLIGGGKLNERIPLSEQEDLIVWMRAATLPTFRKLYGKIETDLEVNDEVVMVIQNNYNTYSFGGTKHLILSTATWIGGKNSFLGFAYIIIGAICLFMAIGYIIMYVIKPRPLGDPSYLSWNKNLEVFMLDYLDNTHL